jgi:hypothetical protein
MKINYWRKNKYRHIGGVCKNISGGGMGTLLEPKDNPSPNDFKEKIVKKHQDVR